MRKRILFLLLLACVLSPRPATAEALRITSGVFFLDIEGDLFRFDGARFALTTIAADGLSPAQPDGLGIYATRQFAPRCGICTEGEPIDWSFETSGEQLLGRGNVQLGGLNATHVDFLGSMRFDVMPTPLVSGGRLEFDYQAPFSFEAMIRGMRNGEQLFAREFIGNGRVSVHYEQVGAPPQFGADDETIDFRFTTAVEPVPEPGTLVLLSTGLAAAGLRRGRRQA